MTDKPILPDSGGSYERAPDGTLKPAKPPVKPAKKEA